MASSAKTVVIRYTDKVVFLAALGVLGYVVVTSFVVKKTTKGDSKLEDIVKLQDQVTRHLNQSKPKPHEVSDLVTGLKKMWDQSPTPSQFRPWLFIRPRPLGYKEVRVRVKGEKKSVKFREKLAAQPQLLIDPSCAKLTMSKEMDMVTIEGLREAEEAKIVATDSRGIRHEVPLVVLAAQEPINVKSPEGLTAEATLEHIAVSWTPPGQDQRVKKEEWLVFRRHEGEDEFKQIATVADTPTHVDRDIRSGEIYFYYVKAEVLTDEGPKQSEKSDTIQLAAKSMVEFELTVASNDYARLLVKRYHNGEWAEQNFSVRRGGFIGGIRPYRGAMVDFATGCTVVDIFMRVPKILVEQGIEMVYDPMQKRRVAREVERRRVVRSNKIIYQDKKDAPREKWQWVQGKSKEARILRAPDQPAAAEKKKDGQAEKKEAGQTEGGGGNLMQRIE